MIAVIGLSFFWHKYHQATQSTLRTLQTNLAAAHVEAQRWRDESHDLMLG